MAQVIENTGNIRHAAVAGLFYPEDPEELRQTVNQLLNNTGYEGPQPRAIVAPHAGYIYSGKTAACAYASLYPFREGIRRIVLLGPAHRVYVRGIATSSADFFSTPLGTIPVDQSAVQTLTSLSQVVLSDEAHAQEHSLEVHLPFLQCLFRDFTLVPLVVGDANPGQVAEVLEKFWDLRDTFIIISSDLSHYHDYASACLIDQATTEAIEHLELELIGSQQACGCRPLCGLLQIARDRNMHVKTLDLRNSGDTAGSRDRVVGYGAYALYSQDPC